jgi:putative DNA primase/helicase
LGNYKPKIRGGDNGIWRRIHLLPFKVTIPPEERDHQLNEKLAAEISGILAWAVRGCLEWQRIGLAPPKEVLDEVNEYRKSEDIFQQWIEECCDIGEHFKSSANGLLQSFIGFSNWRHVSPQKFGRMLTDAGMQRGKSGRVVYNGLQLADTSQLVGDDDFF